MIFLELFRIKLYIVYPGILIDVYAHHEYINAGYFLYMFLFLILIACL